MKLVFLLLMLFGLNVQAQKYFCNQVITDPGTFLQTSYDANMTIDIDMKDKTVTIINYSLKDTAVIKIVGNEIDEGLPKIKSYPALFKEKPLLFQIQEENGVTLSVGLSRGDETIVFKLLEERTL